MNGLEQKFYLCKQFIKLHSTRNLYPIKSNFYNNDTLWYSIDIGNGTFVARWPDMVRPIHIELSYEGNTMLNTLLLPIVNRRTGAVLGLIGALFFFAHLSSIRVSA